MFCSLGGILILHLYFWAGGEAFANNISATKPCRIGLTFLEVSPSLYSLLARAIAVVTDHLPGLQPLWSCVVHDVRHALMT